MEGVDGQQRQLAARTATTGQETQGLDAKKVPMEQAQELAKLAKEQGEIAQKSQAMLDTVQQRSEQMQQSDPTKAQGMKAAAAKARAEQLNQKQKDAAKKIAENKTGEAQKLQEQASKTLAGMLEELDKNQQKKDESLRRLLADVMETIKKLIKQQEGELAKLASAMSVRPGAPAGLDAGMILLHQNTLAAQSNVKTQARGAEKLLQLLSSAGEAQAGAITALRAAPPDQPEADANERVSLTRLKESLIEAEKLEEEAKEREEDRKRQELKKIYSEMLELQTTVTADSAPLVGKKLDRQQRAAARSLGTRQEELRQRMAEVRSKTNELSETQLFDFAHTRYDQSAAAAVTPLNGGEAPPLVGRNQIAAMRILSGLVEALNEADKKKDDFKEDEQEGGGGGGQQGGKPPMIPPIAELKLLRAMQAEAAERTRSLEDAKDDGAAEELGTISQLQSELAKHAQALLDKLKEPGDEGDDKPVPVKERQ